MTAIPAGPLLQVLKRHRQSFSGLKAVGSIKIETQGRKRTFDSVGVVVDGQRRFRIEAFGPLGESVMTVVWNGQELLLRMPNEDKVVHEGPAGLERLLGRGLEASELCAILAGNIPEAKNGAALLLCPANGDCVLEMRSNDVLRKVLVSSPTNVQEEPRILSYEQYRSDDLMFRAEFDKVEEISHYPMPMQIVIENPGKKLRMTILYSEAEVNTPISDEAFSIMDEAKTAN